MAVKKRKDQLLRVVLRTVVMKVASSIARTVLEVNYSVKLDLNLTLIGTKQLREIWRDPKALAVALANFIKVFGVHIRLKICMSDITENSEYQIRNQEYEKLKNYVSEVHKELASMNIGGEPEKHVDIGLCYNDEIMKGIKNIYKFIEIQQ